MSDSFVTPWAVAHQAPIYMGLPRQEYRSGLLFPPPGDLPDPGIKPASPALAVGFFTSEPPGKPHHSVNTIKTPMPPECCPISLYVGIEEKISEKGISSCIFKSNYSDEGQS